MSEEDQREPVGATTMQGSGPGPAATADAGGVRRRGARPASGGSRGYLVLLALLAVVAVSVPVYVLVPLGENPRLVWYDLVAALSLVIGFAGLHLHRPERRGGWRLVLSGYAVWVTGDVVWTLESHFMPDTYPAPSDALYLSAYLLIGAGALAFARSRRGGRDLPALLDAGIITTGVGVLAVVFLIAPLAADSSLSFAGKVVSSAYPLADLFLLGVLVRIYASPNARTASYRLLTVSLGVTLAADVFYDVLLVVNGGTWAPTWLDSGWLFGYVFAGAAAVVPSMRVLAEPVAGRAEGTPSLRRLLVLTAGLMLPTVTLLVDGATGGSVLWPVIVVGGVVMSLLVLLRMIGLLNVVQVQAVRLAALAHSDPLTGAPNRRTWDLELSRACQAARETGKPLSVAVLDLDRFKAYNDANGHQAGDRLLREAVAAWSDVLPAGALLARYGGEEFTVLFPGTAAQTAALALDKLRAVTPDRQTFSAGVAVWTPGTDPAAAIADADDALYAAKRAGRNRVVIHGALDLSAARHRPLPAFTIVVQPITDITTFRVSGHEVLTRFTGPEAAAGIQEVFRAAHDGGDGDLLELAAVLAGIAVPGRPEGTDLYVNVSARALTSERFLAGLPAQLAGVVIEICENTDDVALAVLADAVARVRERGARIALDDVGAGAQEFARLARLRPDIVKIDRSLVRGCAFDRGNAALLRALVAYTEEMGLEVCAEGVEDATDLRQLIHIGVRHAQGYLLGRPDPAWSGGVAAPVTLPAAG
jgi:diguanylate cyclase (GGDEF)-like protein